MTNFLIKSFSHRQDCSSVLLLLMLSYRIPYTSKLQTSSCTLISRALWKCARIQITCWKVKWAFEWQVTWCVELLKYTSIFKTLKDRCPCWTFIIPYTGFCYRVFFKFWVAVKMLDFAAAFFKMLDATCNWSRKLLELLKLQLHEILLHCLSQWCQ